MTPLGNNISCIVDHLDTERWTSISDRPWVQVDITLCVEREKMIPVPHTIYPLNSKEEI